MTNPSRWSLFSTEPMLTVPASADQAGGTFTVLAGTDMIVVERFVAVAGLTSVFREG